MGEKIGIGSYKEKVAGIYKIINLVNGKIYIGSTDCFYNRFCSHKSSLKNGKHKNHELQKDYKQQELKDFNFEAIEVLTAEDCEDGETFKDTLNRRESYWAEQFRTHDCRYGYNVATITKGAPMNSDTREKLAKANSGENSQNAILSKMQVEAICERLIKGARVIDLAKEFKVNQATISMIKTGKRWTDITRKYLKQMKGTYVTDISVNEIRKLLQQGTKGTEIAKMYGISPSTVSQIKNNRANFSDSDKYPPIMSTRGKLTDVKVDEILNLLHQGMTQREIAKRFEVSQPTISLIKNNKGNFNVSLSPLQVVANS